MKITLPHVAIACLIFASGCTHYVHPVTATDIDAYLREGSNKIPEFHGSGSVTVVNGQPEGEQYLLFKAGGHSYYGNRGEWNDIVLRLTERELAKRGLRISSGGKQIAMVVESLQVIPGMWTSEAKAVLKVQVSGGFSATYSGADTGVNQGNMCSEALVNAVAQMLSDKRFVAAVTK